MKDPIKRLIALTACLYLSISAFSQWTLSSTTLHDGDAQITNNNNALWYLNLTDPTPEASDASGIKFMAGIADKAQIVYSYNDNSINFGTDFNILNNSLLAIDLDNPDLNKTSDGIMRIGHAHEPRMAFDKNEIQSMSYGSITNSIYLNHEGGNVSIGPAESKGQIFVKHGKGVGIGTQSPNASLHIASDSEAMRIDGNRPSIYFNVDSINNMILGYQLEGNPQIKKMSFKHSGTADINFSINNTRQATLATNGNFGIGTLNPGHKLTVMSNAYITGEVTVYSDLRLKEDILKIQNASSIIRSLNPVNYSFRKDQRISHNTSGSKRWGLIAQEVEKVLPELVSEIKEKSCHVFNDDPLKSVNYIDLIGILIQSNKEQQERINILIEANKNIENMIKEVEAKHSNTK